MISKTATQPPGTRTGLTDFQGKAAIITGAASGIGLALAEALAARGADLALADIDARGLDTVRARLASTGRRIYTRVLDVSSDADMHAAASEFESKLGKVHLVVNNAGIDMSGAMSTLSQEDWKRAFGVNVFGVINGIRHFVPLLFRHDEPAHVVNTASGAGFWVNSDFPMGAYAATKYSVVALSESLEQELLWHGCRCVSPLPGSCENAHRRTLKHCKRRVQGRHRGRIGARGRGPSGPRGDSRGRVLHLHADAHAGRAWKSDSRGFSRRWIAHRNDRSPFGQADLHLARRGCLRSPWSVIGLLRGGRAPRARAATKVGSKPVIETTLHGESEQFSDGTDRTL